MSLERARLIFSSMSGSSSNQIALDENSPSPSSSSSSSKRKPRSQTDVLASIKRLKTDLYESTVDDQNKLLFLSRLGRGAGEKKSNKSKLVPNQEESNEEVLKQSEAREYLLNEKRKDRDAKACEVAALAKDIRNLRSELHAKRAVILSRRDKVVQDSFANLEAGKANSLASQTLDASDPRRRIERERNDALKLTLTNLVFNYGDKINWFEDERVAWVLMQLENGGNGSTVLPFPEANAKMAENNKRFMN